MHAPRKIKVLSRVLAKIRAGAGERIRTADLRIPSALPGNLSQSADSPESQNPYKIKASETAGNDQEP